MSQLTQNTTDLDALIAKAQALPDAGSGGGTAVETCTVNIDVTNDNNGEHLKLHYLGSDGEAHIIEAGTSYYRGEIECIKGSIILIGPNFMTGSQIPYYLKLSDTLVHITSGMSTGLAVIVNGDGSIQY